MWQFPWRYKESITIVIGILIVGFLLQFTIGSFDFFLLHSPINIIVGAVLILLITLLSFIKKSPWLKWLSSVPLSVTLIGGMLIMALIMGLTPQYIKVNPDIHFHWEYDWAQMSNYFFTKLGFHQVTTSWPFVLIYSFTLLSLGLVTAKRLHRFKWRDTPFFLNHLGLWIFLFSAGFGSADMLRYVMYVEEGEVEWRVFDSHDNMLELDIAIELHEFVMEEYPPKLAIVDKFTGDVQPTGKPAYYQIDQNRPTSKLAKWDLELEEYIHEAVRKSNNSFQAIPMAGSMPAAKINVSNRETGEQTSGWLTCGSIDQFVVPLELDSTYSVVMTKPEAKRFASDITVIVKDENKEPIRATIEVNSPLKVGNWIIYQYDYDHALGKASRTSGFELVYDPWLYLTYFGILLLALGSIAMLWLGNRKDKNK